MEKIEFLASTGISFFAPEDDKRLSDALLNKKWEFRVLKAAGGAISLQQGTTPITGATSLSGEELADCGKIAVKFEDALEACMRKWIPLPYNRKTADRSSPSRSNDWIRLFLSRPPLATDENIIRLVFAVDTTVHQPSGNVSRESFGFFADDAGLPFEANIGSQSFWQSTTLLTWVNSIFKAVKAEGSEQAPPFAASMAAFMALIEGLRTADLLPEVTFLFPEGQNVEVHLILDLGNSRACGIIAENEPGHPINLDECKKLEIRDLREPSEVYTEPFDTGFKFQPPLFYEPENPVPHAGTSFLWPSIVRLGLEAANMDPSDVGDTGMSSPKRYLWDNEQRPFPWYFNLPDSGLGKKIGAPFLKYLDDAGTFKGDKAQPPFEPCYPASSMMTFLVLEILNHVYTQINSYSYRKFRGHRQARRVLKSVVITTPCGMSKPEKAVYRERAQAAIDLYHHACGVPPEEKPVLYFDFDEATCVQLTYIFGEVKHRYLGDALEAVSVLGRERATDQGKRQPMLRVASIDIGGGTSDLMIAEYSPAGNDPSAIFQRMLFSEGFSVAGDEMAKRIIEKVILKHIFEWAQQKKPEISWEEFQMFFGPGKGGRDKKFLDYKAELCRQIWLPMAHKHLEFSELDTDEPNIEIGFDKFFPGRLPASNVLDFFARHMKTDFGCDITLPEIPWELSKRKINSVISNVIENILRMFSEVIAQFECDCVILGGKPSSLPIIREILVKLMPVPPEKIIGLKGYQVGSWYPFSQRGGGIADPKTTCVVGAAIWLFAEKLNNLDGLSLKTDTSRIKDGECFIGSFNPQEMTINQLLFPNFSGSDASLTVNKQILLGTRRMDSDICQVNPLWEVRLDTHNIKSPGPYKVFFKQNAECREIVTLARVEDAARKPMDLKSAQIQLRTMINDQYWLDTGNFDL